MKFSKKTKIVLISAALALCIALASFAFAADYSSADPLISKSYLESVFLPNVLSQLDAKIDAKILELKGASDTIPGENPDNTEEKANPGISYEVITLNAGQKLVAKEGSLEFILRPGASATVYSELESNGVAEMTSGTELLSGANVPINAYCLIPRADGRGIVCTSEIAYVMVRGIYEIQ